MDIINIQEKKILLKFINGGEIKEENDASVLEKWATAGWITFGVDLEKMVPEAKLTEKGKWLISIA